MNTRSIQRALNGGVPHSHNGAELSRGKSLHVLCTDYFCIVDGTILCIIVVLLLYTLPIV